MGLRAGLDAVVSSSPQPSAVPLNYHGSLRSLVMSLMQQWHMQLQHIINTDKIL